jgi:hypothetical protein
MSTTGEQAKSVVGQSHESGRNVGVYHLGFWDGEKRDQQVQSYRDQGHDERTAHVKTRADEMKDVERDPGYRRAAAEDRLAAQEVAQKRDREEARDNGAGRSVQRGTTAAVERVQTVAAQVAQKMVQDRTREAGQGRSR